MTVLLDLDGTLTDPREGILGSIRYAIEGMGVACPADAQLEQYIGPPLQESLAELLGPARRSEAPQALLRYRERFGTVGLFENQVYPGIPEVLAALAASGQRLFLCTSKPAVFAERIVRHFGLDRHLQGVFGSELDGTRTDKRELLRHLLAVTGLSASEVVMVGDRKHDVAAARANGAASIGVTWGFGSPAELREAGADALVDRPAEVPTAVAALGA